MIITISYHMRERDRDRKEEEEKFGNLCKVVAAN